MRKLIIATFLYMLCSSFLYGQNDCSVKSNIPVEAEKLIVDYIKKDSIKEKSYFARVQLSEQRNTFRIWIQKYDTLTKEINNYLSCNQKRINVQGYEIGYFTNEEFFLDGLLFCDTCPHSNQLVSPPYLYIEIELNPPKRLGKVVGYYEKR